ncbi:MAG: hypothetical protein PHD97_04275 [Bacteroidales bacterium]|nr:hypothetical protein [Bacteroidales bacterium]
MKTKILLSILIAFGIIFISTAQKCAINNAVEQQIYKAANEQIQNFLNKIPENNEATYGFTNRNEFSKVTFGKIYHEYALNKNTQQNQLSATNNYRIPLIVDNEFRALITVFYDGSKFKLVDLGATVLAKDIENFEKNQNYIITDKFRIFLRIYEPNSDFISTINNPEQINQCRFYPLLSARNILNETAKNTGAFYTIEQIISIIK